MVEERDFELGAGLGETKHNVAGGASFFADGSAGDLALGDDGADVAFGRLVSRFHGTCGEGGGALSVLSTTPMKHPMSQASRPLTALERQNTIIAVIEMSLSNGWLARLFLASSASRSRSLMRIRSSC